jgi:hypothetical protein
MSFSSTVSRVNAAAAMQLTAKFTRPLVEENAILT